MNTARDFAGVVRPFRDTVGKSPWRKAHGCLACAACPMLRSKRPSSACDAWLLPAESPARWIRGDRFRLPGTRGAGCSFGRKAYLLTPTYPPLFAEIGRRSTETQLRPERLRLRSRPNRDSGRPGDGCHRQSRRRRVRHAMRRWRRLRTMRRSGREPSDCANEAGSVAASMTSRSGRSATQGSGRA